MALDDAGLEGFFLFFLQYTLLHKNIYKEPDVNIYIYIYIHIYIHGNIPKGESCQKWFGLILHIAIIRYYLRCLKTMSAYICIYIGQHLCGISVAGTESTVNCC